MSLTDVLLSYPALDLTVPGTPRPQGSVKPMVNKGTGRAFVKYSDTTVEHRNLLIHEMGTAWSQRSPLDCGVVVTCSFMFERPKSHWRTGRNAHLLKDSAPREMVVAPDGDKLARLVGDALEISGVLANDSQVVIWVSEKVWGPISKTTIRVFPLSGDSA